MNVVSGQAANQTHREYVMIPLLMAVVVGYTLMALLLVRQWGQPDPWSRVNVFSVSGLLFNALLAAQQLRTYRQLPRSQEIKNEAFGYSFDPAMAKWISILGLGELSMYLDYGHWHLVPSLEISRLQMTGVALSVVTLALLFWVDAYLVEHFRTTESSKQLMAEGPYRFIRHPRYLGLILSRTASALTFASIVGWVFLVGWIAVVLRRITLEEDHLDGLFGATYGSYSERAARLLPGLY